MRVIALPQVDQSGRVVYGHSSACEGCGECCERRPGHYLPRDLVEISTEAIARGMLDRKWVADWYEGDPRDSENDNYTGYWYYLRPPAIPDDGRYSNGLWSGRCVNLGENGCGLPVSEMPSGCRMLRPTKTINGCPDCTYDDDRVSIASIAIEWEPYRHIIGDAIALAESKAGGASC